MRVGDFRTQLAIQRDSSTAIASLCHSFLGCSCDGVKLVEDMEKIKTLASGREKCWYQLIHQNV